MKVRGPLQSIFLRERALNDDNKTEMLFLNLRQKVLKSIYKTDLELCWNFQLGGWNVDEVVNYNHSNDGNQHGKVTQCLSHLVINVYMI